MIRRAVLLVVIWGALTGGVGAQVAAPLDASGAMILMPPGATRIDGEHGLDGTSVRIDRIVTSRFQLSVTFSTHELFDLGAKLVVIDDLVPLFLAGVGGVDRIGFVATLFFGPVRFDGGRVWGTRPSRWGRIALTLAPRWTLTLGVDAPADDERVAHVGVRLFPGSDRMWEIAVSLRTDGLRLSAGGWRW